MAVEETAFPIKEPGEDLAPADRTLSSTPPSEEKVQSSCNGNNDITVGVHEAPAAATDDPSLKSPVTPAPVNEYDGSPALRWKSYSGNHREVPSSKSATDSKGKLVINLSGNPRAFVKLSPAPSLIKPFTSEDLNENNSHSNSHSESSQGTLVEHSEKSVSVSTITETAAVAGMACNSAPAVACNSLPLPSSGDGTISEMAKKVRLRVKRSRIPVKPNLFQRRAEESEFSLPRKNLEERMPKVEAVVRDIVEPGSRASEPPSFIVQDKGHITSQLTNEDTWIAKESSGDLQTSKEAACVDEIESLERKKPNEASLNSKIGSLHELSCGVNAGIMLEELNDIENGDQELNTSKGFDKYEPVENIAGGVVASLADTHADKERLAPEPLSSEQQHPSNVGCSSRENRVRYSSRAPSVSGYDNGTTSETSKFDMKDRTILDTLLPDEPPGYSSGGCSEPSRVQEPGRVSDVECSQTEDSETGDSQSEKDDAESSRSEGYDDEESYSEESEDVDVCIPSKGLSPGTPHRGALFSEQVPSVLCDAEGNVWHIGKRAEQARGTKVSQGSHPVEVEIIEKAAPVRQSEVEKEVLEKTPPLPEVVPYSHLIQLNWKWPSDADYTFSVVPDTSNRSMVVKEKSVFVGCIPDGVDHLEELLQSLMEKFLERFDFAPAPLGRIQVVKVVKDFAFLELATEKVAQIVLAANQLDVFEWGVNGYHLNIQGCSGTHSSVRPLIEYVSLKPSRVILVSNIPKSRWQKDYLEAFFSRLLRGSDGASASKLVSAVYLLPESCDAYLEFASDLMAESLIYKCSKNPLLLKDIGEDVFICRDASSVPLMSRHKGVVNPQRSLFIGVSPRGEEFKIDCIRKVFEEILPVISKELNQPGYIEYIFTLPGKDYAFFQFNSEAIVDAIMNEYIANTQIFVCKSSPVPYIILRPPEYVRPGVKVNAYMDCKSQVGYKRQFVKKGVSAQEMQERSGSEQPGKFVSKTPRRFGDEPIKKPDCLMSIGASASPLVTWNGLSFLGACSADPDSMLVVEGLPKGISYKLLRGALNELFERSLSRTGLLDVGMLVLRFLDRDGNFDVTASLPSPNFVIALLSMRQPFLIAGHEIRLFPKEGRRNFSRSIELLGGQGDLSCLTDEDAGQVKRFRKNAGDEWMGPGYVIERKHGRNELDHQFVSINGPSRRKGVNGLARDEWKGGSPLQKQVGIKAHYKEMRRLQNGTLKKLGGSKFGQGSLPDKNWMGSPHAVKVHQSRMARGSVLQVKEGGSSFVEYPNDVLKIVAMEGRREVQNASGPFLVRDIGMPVGKVLARPMKKRKSGGPAGPFVKLGLGQKRFQIRPQFS